MNTENRVINTCFQKKITRDPEELKSSHLFLDQVIKRLLEVFLYAHQHYGVDVFLLDSLLKCNIAEDDYNAQKAFIEKLCDFKNEHPCHIHVIAHPRKSMDETIIPGKFDIKGTDSISDLADNCFSIWRNKEKKSLHDPDCLWTCNKQRWRE